MNQVRKEARIIKRETGEERGRGGRETRQTVIDTAQLHVARKSFSSQPAHRHLVNMCRIILGRCAFQELSSTRLHSDMSQALRGASLYKGARGANTTVPPPLSPIGGLMHSSLSRPVRARARGRAGTPDECRFSFRARLPPRVHDVELLTQGGLWHALE